MGRMKWLLTSVVALAAALLIHLVQQSFQFPSIQPGDMLPGYDFIVGKTRLWEGMRSVTRNALATPRGTQAMR